jgi:hypothetical protein
MPNTRVSQQLCEKYLARFRSGHFETIDGDLYCILEGYPEWLRIYFLGGQLPLPLRISELAEKVLRNLRELDRLANSDSSTKKYEPYLMNIYIHPDEEIELHYCSNVVNTEWGAFFRENKEGKIEFVELG